MNGILNILFINIYRLKYVNGKPFDQNWANKPKRTLEFQIIEFTINCTN